MSVINEDNKMFITIKGIQHEVIEENGIKYYKNHFCNCPCQQKIPVKENHKKDGISKFITSHWQKTSKAKNIMSKRMSGKNHPFFGTHWSEELKQKQSKKMKGKHTGKDHYFYGKHHTEKTKLILSESAKLRTGSKNPFFRKNHTQESIKLIKQNMPDLSGKNNPMYGKQTPHGKKIFPHSTPFQGTLKMFRWDRKYAQYLDLNNIKYYYENKYFELILNNKNVTYTPDFYLPNTNEYIEIKGYWKGDAKEKFEAFKLQYPEIKINLLMNLDLKQLNINTEWTEEEKKIKDNYKNHNKCEDL